MKKFKLRITGIDLLNDYGSPSSCPIACALNRHFKDKYSVGGWKARLVSSDDYYLSWKIEESEKVANRAGKWWNIFTLGVTIEINYEMDKKTLF